MATDAHDLDPEEVPHIDDQWKIIQKLEADWRRSNWTKAALVVFCILELLVIVWLATANLSLVDKDNCRSGHFAIWADDVLLVLDDKKDLSEVKDLEAAYNECGR
jgi:hypothetical protein